MLAVRRDRWFLGEGLKRRGPVPFEQLVHLLLAEPDPRAPLVWHKGFASWTRAEDVPQVERRLAPALARATNAAEAINGVGVSEVGVSGPGPLLMKAAAIDQGKPGSALLVYGSLAAGVTALALLGWLFWPRAETPVVLVPPGPPPVESPAPSPHRSPDVKRSPAPAPRDDTRSSSPAPPDLTRSHVPSRPPHPAPELGQEAELPTAELRKLRKVAAWSGEKLALTVENRTAWRVTELRVRVSRIVGEELRPDAGLHVLRPRAEELAPAVADMMGKVAPDRMKPGVNPHDTGSFEAQVSPPPEGFRCEIESALGYPPR